MEKKIIFLELPNEIIEKIDEKNKLGSRSLFISELIKKELENDVLSMDFSSELSTKMNIEKIEINNDEINLVNSNGVTLGKFNINTVEGFENLNRKIGEITSDPAVKMKANR